MIARDPWEQREGESGKAFAGFVAYRDTPPSARSIVKACRALHGSRATPGRVSSWEKWSTANQWVSRAKAWDRERDRIKRAAESVAIEEMQARHIEAAGLLLDVARTSLSRLLAAMEEDATLRIPTQHLAALTRAAVDLERITRGVPDQIIETTQQVVRLVWGDEAGPEESDGEDWPYDITPILFEQSNNPKENER